MMTHISPSELTRCLKVQINKYWWRAAAILKNVKCYISAAIWLILMKFGMTMRIRLHNLMGNQKF